MLSREPNHPRSRARTVTFVLLAYAFTWLITVPLALSAHEVFGLSVPEELHYLAQFGPMIAAIAATFVFTGREGLRDLIGRIGRWRVGVKWWIVALSPAALFLVGMIVVRAVDGEWPAIRDVGEVNFLPYLGIAVIPFWIVVSGLGEEVGWRGYLLPTLQRGRPALRATMILWPIWAGWYVPAFFYLPSYRDMGLMAIPSVLFGTLAGAILLTWIYNSSGSSILIVVIWHGLFNTFTASEAGHGTVAMMMSVIVSICAVSILFLARPETLSGLREQREI